MLLLTRLVATLVLIAVLFLVFGSIAIIFEGLHDQLHAADLAVVPGSKVDPDGEPSPALQARLDRAVDLYRQGYFKLILVSGAHGKEGYDEPVAMRYYLEAQGLPPGGIFEDNRGIKTWETARDTAAFLKEHHLKSVLVISQYFHLPRCRLALAKFGIDPVYTSYARYWSVRDLWSVPREVVGWVVYRFRSPAVGASR